MRIESFVVLILALAITSYDHDDVVETDGYARQFNAVDLQARLAAIDLDADLNIFQRTCALYVAIRSGSFNDPMAIDQEIDETMARWNICTMVQWSHVPKYRMQMVRYGKGGYTAAI